MELTNEQLITRWAPMLDAGEKITNASTKKALARVFENTYNNFKQNGLVTEAKGSVTHGETMGVSPVGSDKSTGYLKGPYGRENGPITKDGGNIYLPNVIMPLLRRIFPSLIAHELVGVQALNGPVGYALAYRAKYGKGGGVGDEQGRFDGDEVTAWGKTDSNLTAQPGEIGFNPVDTRYTGTDGNLTALTSDAALTAWTDYAGGEATAEAVNAHPWAGRGQETGAAEFASFFKGTYPTVSFDFLTQMVRARTRKLGAGWSPELAEDMEAMHNFDVETEFVNMVSYEIGAAIDRQLMSEIIKAALLGGSVTTWSPAKADGLDQMGRLATLLAQITIEANQIAIRTRRGHANFVVTSPRVTALLEQLSFNKFVSIQNTSKDAPSVPDSGVGALTKVGMINDGQQLLVRDTYAAKDYVVMGYKGAHPADNGIIYCPYIPVELKKVVDPDTLTNRIGARTRYGVMNSVWDSKNYYSFIRVADLTGTYQFSTGDRQFIQGYSPVTNGTIFC